MKKLLASVLAAAMLLTVAASASVLAEDPAPLAEGLALAEGSRLKLDTEPGYIDKIDGTITVADLKANFSGNVAVTSPDGTAKADDAAVATDDIVKAGEDSAKAIIYGDADRNGKINLTDIIGMMKHAAMWSDVGISETAADVDKTGKVNLNDVAKMLKYLAGWDDISLGNVRMVFENTAIEAENEDDTLKLSFTNFMNKLGAHETEHTGEHSFKMKLAKNEYESCTVLLWSDTAKDGMTAELTDFVYEYGDTVLPAELEWIVYQPGQSVFTQVIPWDVQNQQLKIDEHPEALVDMADTFELEAEAHQQFAITVHSGKDTPAGMYKATLTVKDADGKEVKKANVYACVYDFALPDTPYSASLFNTGYSSGNNNEYTYYDYFDYMLEQNLSSYKLPYSITSDEADAVMSDPRVTAFIIDGFSGTYTGDITDEETVAAYNKIKDNPDWFSKGLFYYTDEPYGTNLQDVKTTYEYVTNLLGTTNIRNITPLAGNNTYADEECRNNGIDPVAYIDPYINVWCPQSPAFHLAAEGGGWTGRRHMQTYGEFPDRAKAFMEKGEEMWWYVCCSPEVPYANYFTPYQGVIVRLLSWQQYFNNVNGVLYYQTLGGSISKYNFDIGNGDGILMYPGELWGRSGPSASWRLYQIRDGFDDIDYMNIAEELVGRETVMKVVNKVTQGMLRYTEDYKVLDAARDEIVKLILANQDK